MKRGEERYMAVIGLLAACLIAAHDSTGSSPAYLLGAYCYWLIRIAAEGLIFFGVRSTIENYAPKSFPSATTTGLAIIISHLPFVLSVTAMDIVLGHPELGIDSVSPGTTPRITELALELLYLFDNHLAVCLLLTVPRWILRQEAGTSLSQDDGGAGTLLSTIAPPLNGEVLWVEAQEHYVRITTQHEKRMVLARFSDIVRELSPADGQQVHRSHWVARAAVVEESKSGQNLSLLLTTGDRVPVSRSFKSQLATLRKDQR